MNAVGFPPHASPDLVDRLSVIRREWRRDNGLWCKEELQDLLLEYPWSKEAADLYGLISAKIRHIYSPKAMLRLHEWFAQEQMKLGKPYVAGEALARFRVIKEVIKDWLIDHAPATLVDIGAQQGEMDIHFIGLAGVRYGVAVEIARTNCLMGNFFYKDARLHFCQALAERVPLRDNAMDIAVVSGILEHVLDPDAIVAEAIRVVRPGGLVVLQVPYGGMEGPPNPAADNLSFRGHVRCVDPFPYVVGHDLFASYYLQYDGDVNYSQGLLGAAGDFVVAFEVKKNGILPIH